MSFDDFSDAGREGRRLFCDETSGCVQQQPLGRPPGDVAMRRRRRSPEISLYLAWAISASICWAFARPWPVVPRCVADLFGYTSARGNQGERRKGKAQTPRALQRRKRGTSRAPGLELAHLLGGPTDTGSTDTQGPRDGNAGKKSSRSRMRGLLDWRKPRSRGRMPGSRQANGNKARQPPAQATQPRAAGPNVYGDSEFHLPPPLSTGNAQVWSHRSAAVSCPMPCSCSSAPSPVPSGPR